ncbi:MAG TPA: hypothetical protein VFB62_26415, partial [Polyangiaceae bacterium]|nr:hypothetical protein [Polyangiaceae bacterium]
LVIVIPVLIWAAAYSKRLVVQTNQAWRDAAEQLGGTFVPVDVGRFRAKSPRIVATVDGIDVTVDHFRAVSSENEATYHTRVRAAARAPKDFSLRISRAHALSGLARALGFQDVSIGDRAFDAEYVIKTNDPTTAKLWLNRSVRKHIHLAQHYAFELEGGAVKAETTRLETDAREIVSAVRAVVAMADGRGRLLRVWGAFARKHKGSVKPHRQRWATLDLELEGVDITIDTANDDDHYTFASAHVVGPAHEPFVLVRVLPDEISQELDDLPGYALHARKRDAALERLDERARRAIVQLGPSEVRVEDGEVTVRWPGVSVDARELEQASALVAMLASSSVRGPYR